MPRLSEWFGEAWSYVRLLIHSQLGLGAWLSQTIYHPKGIYSFDKHVYTYVLCLVSFDPKSFWMSCIEYNVFKVVGDGRIVPSVLLLNISCHVWSRPLESILQTLCLLVETLQFMKHLKPTVIYQQATGFCHTWFASFVMQLLFEQFLYTTIFSQGLAVEWWPYRFVV